MIDKRTEHISLTHCFKSTGYFEHNGNNKKRNDSVASRHSLRVAVYYSSARNLPTREREKDAKTRTRLHNPRRRITHTTAPCEMKGCRALGRALPPPLRSGGLRRNDAAETSTDKRAAGNDQGCHARWYRKCTEFKCRIYHESRKY